LNIQFRTAFQTAVEKISFRLRNDIGADVPGELIWFHVGILSVRRRGKREKLTSLQFL
jgi:hypothetical protein